MSLQAKPDKTSIFKKIELILNDIFPRDIEKILIATGFESKSLISLITESTINIIEEHINSDLSILEETSYDSSKSGFVFKLKPGHKEFILNLLKLLNQSKENKQKSKNKENDGKKENEQNKLKLLDAATLKGKMVQRVTDFFERNSYTVNFDTTCIDELKYFENKIKTKLACPFCSAKRAVDYTSYWNISNLQKHFKVHFDQPVDTVTNTNTEIFEAEVRCVSGEHEHLLNILLLAVCICICFGGFYF